MAISPLRVIQDVIFSSLMVDRPIRSVLIGPDLWIGFLLQIDTPGSYEDLKKVTYVDGNRVIEKHMEKVKKGSNYYEEYPFFFKLNRYIKGVRVTLYPKIL